MEGKEDGGWRWGEGWNVKPIARLLSQHQVCTIKKTLNCQGNRQLSSIVRVWVLGDEATPL